MCVCMCVFKVYPKNDITNIVESSHYVKIGNWCKMGYNKCKHTDWVKPYRCLGECAFHKRFTFSRVSHSWASGTQPGHEIKLLAGSHPRRSSPVRKSPLTTNPDRSLYPSTDPSRAAAAKVDLPCLFRADSPRFFLYYSGVID